LRSSLPGAAKRGAKNWAGGDAGGCRPPRRDATKRGKVSQFAQWCHALEVLGKKLKSTSKTRKMLLASGRVKHVGRGRHRLIDGVENRAPKKSAKPRV
jgi:hypothetical protein